MDIVELKIKYKRLKEERDNLIKSNESFKKSYDKLANQLEELRMDYKHLKSEYETLKKIQEKDLFDGILK